MPSGAFFKTQFPRCEFHARDVLKRNRELVKSVEKLLKGLAFETGNIWKRRKSR
jgi:hypothetical protein